LPGTSEWFTQMVGYQAADSVIFVTEKQYAEL